MWVGPEAVRITNDRHRPDMFRYPTLYPDPEHLQIFGVVTHFVHRTREKP